MRSQSASLRLTDYYYPKDEPSETDESASRAVNSGLLTSTTFCYVCQAPWKSVRQSAGFVLYWCYGPPSLRLATWFTNSLVPMESAPDSTQSRNAWFCPHSEAIIEARGWNSWAGQRLNESRVCHKGEDSPNHQDKMRVNVGNR